MAWKTGNLFGAVQPQDPAHYYNIFRFGGGHVVALALRAESDNGRYAGDSLTVMDLTNTSDIQGWHHEIGRYESNSLNNGFRYSLSFRPTGSDTIARLTDNYGIIAEVSINTLYRLRVKDPVNTQVYIGEREFYQGAQGGPRGGSLFYSARTYEMADDPTANAGDLTPTYVVFVNKRVGVSNVHLGDAPLGDSGYVLHYDDADGSLEVKKAD